MLQIFDLCILEFELRGEFLIQALDCRQRHSALVENRDVAVVGAEAKRRMEILGHGADVRCGGISTSIFDSPVLLV